MLSKAAASGHATAAPARLVDTKWRRRAPARAAARRARGARRRPPHAPAAVDCCADPGPRLPCARRATSPPCRLKARCCCARRAAERLLAPAGGGGAGLGLKVFDCYRPLSVQRAMWTVFDERYVADPAKGSRHNRGAAVDLTLVDANGRELPMPTGFDDFSARAHRDYDDLPPAVLANRAQLERLMTDAGFTGLLIEWWHFDADGWERFDVLDVPLDSATR
ncbi:MAG: M15 family metallopeptidase [Candidatus Binatia bacterium]